MDVCVAYVKIEGALTFFLPAVATHKCVFYTLSYLWDVPSTLKNIKVFTGTHLGEQLMLPKKQAHSDVEIQQLRPMEEMTA